jgi:hypothetical protein
LYEAGLLNLGPIIQSQKNEKSETSTELKFWRSFEQALDQNKRGLNGIQRIVSIIAEEFGPKELHDKLKVRLLY